MDRRIINHSSLLAVFVMIICLMPLQASVSAASSDDDYVPQEIIVRLKPDVNVASFASQNGLDNRAKSIDRVKDSSIYRFKITDGSSPTQKAAALRQGSRGRVAYAEPNYIGHMAEAVARSSWAKGSGEVEYHAQWAATKLRLSEAHTQTRGAGITVAVLDTGVDATHPLLAPHLAPGYDFVDLDVDPREEGTYGRDIAYGHGTHVAGLVLLVAPDATILPLRVLKPDGTGNNWAILQALQYARDHNAAVINLSYAVSGRSRAIDDLLDTLTCDEQTDSSCSSTNMPGIVVTAAAGNSGSPRREYPAASPSAGVISVAASTEADTIASFSTAGNWVRVAAPGEHISSSVPLNSGSVYGSWSGTSMAAPLAAGIVALIRATHPTLSPAQVADRLITGAVIIEGRVQQRVDAAAALAN